MATESECIMLYCTWRSGALTTGPHGQVCVLSLHGVKCLCSQKEGWTIKHLFGFGLTGFVSWRSHPTSSRARSSIRKTLALKIETGAYDMKRDDMAYWRGLRSWWQGLLNQEHSTKNEKFILKTKNENLSSSEETIQVYADCIPNIEYRVAQKSMPLALLVNELTNIFHHRIGQHRI